VARHAKHRRRCRNQLIDLNDQTVAATGRGDEPFLRLEPEETTMNTLRSHDGTTIAYGKQGDGPALVVVDGALTVHSSGSGSELAKLLAPHFTVYGFDRRGRGESGDTLPYAVDREIDDIEVLIDRAGGPAFLYGHSSGGPLAMRAAIRLGRKVSKIAMYEPPYNNDPAAQEPWSQYLRQLKQALAEGRRGDAVALFMGFVGTPAEQIDSMRRAPFWPGLEAVAPTLAYDHAAVLGEPWSVPAKLAARVSVPALVMAGDASLPFMPDTARVLSQAIPHGRLRVLAGQTHEVNPGVLAPVLAEFF
jgi:pimeloyl-ACP methyl ester carboxylesterase